MAAFSSTSPTFRRVRESLAAAAEGDIGWDAPARAICDAVGADAASLLIWKAGTHEVLAAELHANSPSMLDEYREHYYAHDTLLQRASDPRHKGGWLISDEQLSSSYRSRSPLFGDLLARYGLRQVLAVNLRAGGDVLAGLSLQRSREAPLRAADFETGALALMTRQLIAAFHQRFGLAQAARLALEEALSSPSESAFLIDDRGRPMPLHHRPLPTSRGSLTIKDSQLRHDDLRCNAKLFCALQAALRGQRSSVTLPAGRALLAHLEFMPLPSRAALVHTSPLVLAQLAWRTTDALAASPDDLVSVLGVTRAQAAVLHQLCAGLPPKRIADRLAISVGTVRAHISQMQMRTGCRRATDLVRLAHAVS